MLTPVHRKRQAPRAWLIPSILAAILFIGGVAGNLVANYVQTSLDPYRRWVWVSFGIALLVAIVVAIRESRWATASVVSSGEPQTSGERSIEGSSVVSTQGERSVALGRDVKGSAIITGDENVAVVGSRVDGDVFGGDKITHIYEASTHAATALHQLRGAVRDFVGREQEIATVISALRAGNHAGISGMGGAGKTELALLVAESISNEYPDAQLLINLQGNHSHPRPPEEALATFIRAFLGPEARLPDDLDQLSQLYRSQLSQKRVLIVLDNAANSSQVRPLMPPTGCAVMVTSREAVSLPGMIRLTLNPLAASESHQLLLEIAPHAAPVGVQICLLCGYLPLAIRAAGSLLATTPDLNPADYAAQLQEEHTRLGRFGKEGVEIDVEASFNLSYARLEPESARVFRKLVVFPGAFDATAEEAVCADDGHINLSNLVRRSLVLYDPQADRYRLHDLVRLFGEARLSDEERSVGRRLHAKHYKGVLALADSLYLKGGEAFGRGLALFDLEWGNIKAGHAWSESEAQGDDQAAQLGIAYCDAGVYVLTLRQHPRERIRWLDLAVDAARRLRKRDSEGTALSNLGNAYAYLGETRRAIELYQQHLAIARELDDRRGEGNALGNLGIAYANLGESRRAIEFHEQRLDIAREIDDRRGEGNALNSLASAYGNLGEFRRAIDLYEQYLAIAREIGDRRDEANALGNLGTVYKNLGKTSQAIEFYEQSLLIAREIGDRRGEGAALGNLGNAYGNLGETRRRIEFNEQALLIDREIGYRRGEATDLGNLANAYANLGESRRAIDLYEQQLAIVREIGDRSSEGSALGNLGIVYAELGETRRAVELYEQNLAIAREVGDRLGEGLTLFNHSLELDVLGQRAQAIAGVEEAVTIFEEVEAPNAAQARALLAKWRSQAR